MLSEEQTTDRLRDWAAKHSLRLLILPADRPPVQCQVEHATCCQKALVTLQPDD